MNYPVFALMQRTKKSTPVTNRPLQILLISYTFRPPPRPSSRFSTEILTKYKKNTKLHTKKPLDSAVIFSGALFDHPQSDILQLKNGLEIFTADPVALRSLVNF